MKDFTKVIQIHSKFILETFLLIKSGEEGDFTDSTIERTSDGKLHINGYVWASLIRRALQRFDDGKEIAKKIGKYEADKNGVSPLWCEASFIENYCIDIRPGNRLDRQLGSALPGALFFDEVVSPGILLDFYCNYFFDGKEDEKKIIDTFLKAFSVINSGIENIGGGWSYGHGRIRSKDIFVRVLDLNKNLESLWNFQGLIAEVNKQKITELKEEEKNWMEIDVKAKILDGQLLAIHSDFPLVEDWQNYKGMDAYPDAFVYKQHYIEGSTKKSNFIITGRAIRQNLFAKNIERILRTKKEDICENPKNKCNCSICQKDKNLKVGRNSNCKCKLCDWFGSMSNGGILAITDAFIENADTVILNRVQLCEHTMQNINLFQEEYLTKGDFKFKILIDKKDEELKNYIIQILEDCKEKGPPGWYRIGSNSTSTGQIKVISY